MFGYHRRKREKKRKKAAKKVAEQQKQQAMQQEAADIENTSLPTEQEVQTVDDRANALAEKENQRLKEAREGHKKEAMEDINTPVQGLDPKARQAMQESANAQIGGHLQNYSRMLASSQGARGVRGGKAQSDLRRGALNAQNEVTRDITQQDIELAKEKLGAYLTSLEGKQANNILNKQQARDLLLGEQEKKKNSKWTQYNNKYFNKV